jgi:energy-coupling factor transporter transmembrane protein EcfT
MADRLSQRRAQTNQFYLTVLSALVVILSLVISNKLYLSFLNLVIGVVGVVGIIFCFIWHFNIQSYRQLNTGKFAVIHEMEAKLSYAPFKREWEELGEGKDNKKYFPLTHVEKYLPWVMALLYGFLIICAIKSTIWPDQIINYAANCTLIK